MRPPAFQFYADDFLAGTADMTNEEVGAYIRLLCQQWTKGGLPKEPERLSMMAGAMPVPSLGYVLAKFRPCDDGLLRNARLERVREEQDAYRKQQAEKGKIGAEKRWKNSRGHSPAMAQAMPKQWPDDGSPSPTPSPNNTLAPKARARNPVIDALACIDGSQLDQITEPAWAAAGKALSQIKAVTPEVTPDEIRRRAQNYRTKYRDATISPLALAKHWAALNSGSDRPKEKIAVWGEDYR